MTDSLISDNTSAMQRIALLYRISQTFNSTLDLDEVLNHVMDEVITATKAEHGFVITREDSGELKFLAARGVDQQDLESAEREISRTIVKQVLDTGEAVLTQDALGDPRFSEQSSVLFLKLVSILCVPLIYRETVKGAIYVENRVQKGIFKQVDLDLLSAIALSAAVAIENARLYLAAVEKGRMERELQMARTVQTGLLPSVIPQPDGWDLAAHWKPARDVSGDFYDFIQLENADSSLGLTIADVTDKGMPAALFMAFTRSIIRASVHQAASPAEGITHANDLICDESDRGLLVTVFYAQLNPVTGELVYVNAGHDAPIYYRAADRKLRHLEPTGVYVGIMENYTFQQEYLIMEPGDFVVCFTDGIPEAINVEEQDYGIQRLEELILMHKDRPADELATLIEQDVLEFCGEEKQSDDITIVVVKRNAIEGN